MIFKIGQQVRITANEAFAERECRRHFVGSMVPLLGTMGTVICICGRYIRVTSSCGDSWWWADACLSLVNTLDALIEEATRKDKE